MGVAGIKKAEAMKYLNRYKNLENKARKIKPTNDSRRVRKKEMMKEAKKIKAEIQKEINMVELDELERKILVERFVKKNTWVKICERLYYSDRSWLGHKQGTALEKFYDKFHYKF